MRHADIRASDPNIGTLGMAETLLEIGPFWARAYGDSPIACFYEKPLVGTELMA